jgi:NADPH2:quinone reductase
MSRAVQFDRFGGPEVLRIVDVPMPQPGAGEVVVAVQAAGINPGESYIREGRLEAVFPTAFPSGEGSDLAGVVSAVGEGVSGLSTGDEVLGWSARRSSHADYVAVPAHQLTPKPAALSWEAAGALYVVGVTAYAAVRAVGAGAGETAVVSAAAGGVGSVAAQLLRVRGAEVIGIASPANHDWLASVGVTPVAYGSGLLQRIQAAAPSGVDAFIDTFGPEYVKLAIGLGVAQDRIDTVIAFEAAKEFGVKAEGSADASSPEVLAEVADLVAAGRIEIPIAAAYPLARVGDAYAELQKRHTRGKIVLIP